MESFSVTGNWWLPDHSDRPVAGTLHFDPSEGGQLDLVGALSGDDAAFEALVSEEEQRHPIVQGTANGVHYTLINCLCVAPLRHFSAR
jgi:hypothetical protein